MKWIDNLKRHACFTCRQTATNMKRLRELKECYVQSFKPGWRNACEEGLSDYAINSLFSHAYVTTRTLTIKFGTKTLGIEMTYKNFFLFFFEYSILIILFCVCFSCTNPSLICQEVMDAIHVSIETFTNFIQKINNLHRSSEETAMTSASKKSVHTASTLFH